MLDGQSDEALMLAYGAGDLAAFEIIYRRHSARLYRYLLRQCGNADDAQELLQDVWTNLIRARARYEVRAKFSTYLFRLAHNRVIDHYRRRSHNPVYQGTNPGNDEGDMDLVNLADVDIASIEDHLYLRRLGDRLRELIAQLPPVQREAFLLREEGGLSVEEIAEVTGVNAETAKSRLRYAVAKLRKGLRGQGAVDDE
jgi:RNA polymerase sigma-70 factor (ECF subfamily)